MASRAQRCFRLREGCVLSVCCPPIVCESLTPHDENAKVAEIAAECVLVCYLTLAPVLALRVEIGRLGADI